MPHRFVLLALSFFAAALDAQVAAPSTKPKEWVISTGSVEGVVLDAITGLPISGAIVTLHQVSEQTGTGQPAGPKRTGTTSEGHFVFEDILAGKYRVFAESQGYVAAEYGARAPGSSGAIIDLTGEQDVRDVAFRLLPHSVVSGHVIDEEGQPVRAAIVRALQLRYIAGRKQFLPSRGGTTNASGEYRITGLAPGRYYVLAQPSPNRKQSDIAPAARERAVNEGYIPAFYPAAESEAAALAVDLGTAVEIGRIDIKVRRSKVVDISGQTIGATTGRPVAGVTVTLAPAENSDLAVFLRRNAMSDERGGFQIAGVPPGSYIVTGEFFDDVTRYSTIERIAAREATARLELQLFPGVTVMGKIREERRDVTHDFSAVQVVLQSRTDPVFGRIQEKSDAHGIFQLTNVVPGQFDVSATNLPEGTYVQAVRYGDQDLSGSRLIVSPGGAAPLEIVVGVSDTSASGVVLDSDSKPVSGALVAIVPDESRRDYDYLYRAVTTNDAGRFSIRAIAPGKYTAFAWRTSEDAGFRDPGLIQRIEQYGVTIDLSETNSASIELRLIPPGS